MRYTSLCRRQPAHWEDNVTTWPLPENPVGIVDWCLRPARHLLIWLTFGEARRHEVVSLRGHRWLNMPFNEDAVRLIAKLPLGLWPRGASGDVELTIRLVITGP